MESLILGAYTVSLDQWTCFALAHSSLGTWSVYEANTKGVIYGGILDADSSKAGKLAQIILGDSIDDISIHFKRVYCIGKTLTRGEAFDFALKYIPTMYYTKSLIFYYPVDEYQGNVLYDHSIYS